ncbi:MAG: Hpt domain-containing protein [Dechloromonas sp.]|nr:Hpt domain-containing protein [Dechloromonas sp.]
MSPFVLDRPAVLERLGDDEDIMFMMLGMCCDDVENNCRELSEALVAADLEGLRRAAHTVKGTLASVSDDDGAALAFALEKQARAGELAGAEALLLALQARLRHVAGVLASVLASR